MTLQDFLVFFVILLPAIILLGITAYEWFKYYIWK